MAEKYGSIPEKFTKAWWEYYWEYYRWYVIIPLVIVIAVGTTVYVKLTEPKYDLTLTYAANNIISEENEEKLAEKLSGICEDVDKNGESSLFLSTLLIQSNPKQADIEYVNAASTKLQLGFAEDEKYIFIMDKEVAQLYTGEFPEDCPYAPVENWAKNLPADAEFFTEHGINYGVRLSDNKFLKDYGINLSDHYIFIRYYPRKDQQKRQLEGYKAAINLANKIIADK